MVTVFSTPRCAISGRGLALAGPWSWKKDVYLQAKRSLFRRRRGERQRGMKPTNVKREAVVGMVQGII